MVRRLLLRLVLLFSLLQVLYARRHECVWTTVLFSVVTTSLVEEMLLDPASRRMHLGIWQFYVCGIFRFEVQPQGSVLVVLLWLHQARVVGVWVDQCIRRKMGLCLVYRLACLCCRCNKQPASNVAVAMSGLF